MKRVTIWAIILSFSLNVESLNSIRLLRAEIIMKGVKGIHSRIKILIGLKSSENLFLNLSLKQLRINFAITILNIKNTKTKYIQVLLRRFFVLSPIPPNHNLPFLYSSMCYSISLVSNTNVSSGKLKILVISSKSVLNL